MERVLRHSPRTAPGPVGIPYKLYMLWQVKTQRAARARDGNPRGWMRSAHWPSRAHSKAVASQPSRRSRV